VKKTIVALAFAASLLPLSAAAQQTGMGNDAHHPGTMENGSPAASRAGAGGTLMMPMMQGMPNDQPSPGAAE
jgi:hypothetical protein